MSGLFETIESCAIRGADGLSAEGRAGVTNALLGLRCADGGFMGLDGLSDPYYTLFAWLSLRAVGAGYDRASLCAYLATRLRDEDWVGAWCARFVFERESGWSAGASLRLARVALTRRDARGLYAAFLLAVEGGVLPRWLSAVSWMLQARALSRRDVTVCSTPRLAAATAWAALSGKTDPTLVNALRSRRVGCGGYGSAWNAAPDLLATAVARFAFALASFPISPNEQAADLAFVEACWMPDGLFGPSPTAERGDAEHTLYGLLALGTCRR